MVSDPKDLDIRRESLISAVANVAIIAAQLLTLGVLTRALPSGEVGAYFFALAVALIAIIPSRELSEVMRKRVSEVGTPSSQYFGLAQIGTAVYLVVFGVVLLLGAPILTASTPLSGPAVLAFGVYTVALTQSAMSTRLWDAVGSPGASMMAQAVRDVVFFGTVIALVQAGLATPASVLLVRAGVHLCSAAAIYAVLGLKPGVPTRESITHGFEYGKWALPIGITGHIWGQAPTILLGMLLGGSAVALYETVKRLTMAGAYLATCINDPLFIKASAMASTGEDVGEYVRLALDYTPSVAIPTVFIAAPVATEILVVGAGPTYAAGGLALVGIAAYHVLSGIRTPLVAGLMGVDKPRYVCYLSIGTLLVGLPGIVVGTTVAGLEGLVAVLLLIELANVVVAEVAVGRVLGEYVLPETFHVQLGAASVAGLVAWVANLTLDLTTAPALATVLAGAIAIHYGLFYLASTSFRGGTIRTVRDVRRLVDVVPPA